MPLPDMKALSLFFVVPMFGPMPCGWRGDPPSSVLVICEPISRPRVFRIWFSLLCSGWQHPQLMFLDVVLAFSPIVIWLWLAYLPCRKSFLPPSVLGAVCRPIQLPLETCTVLLTVLQEPSIDPSVSGAVDWPCLLQALLCWMPFAGPVSCSCDVYSAAHSTPGAVHRPFSLGNRRSALFAAGPSVLGAICRPIRCTWRRVRFCS